MTFLDSVIIVWVFLLGLYDGTIAHGWFKIALIGLFIIGMQTGKIFTNYLMNRKR